MPDASNEYCLEMILSHEPTETGKKMREMGIDGQCTLYTIKIIFHDLNEPAVSVVQVNVAKQYDV